MKLWTIIGPAGLALLASAVPAGTAAPTAAAAPAPAHAVRITNSPRILSKLSASAIHQAGWSSSNWSGYAITGSTYHSITGSWVVPTVQPSRGDTYSSNWIGIDGFNNSDLIQTGTEQDASSSGTSYGAWWEILPAAETPISSMTVHPGDHMSASIVDNNNGTWTITISDTTTGQSFTTTQSYSGPAQSAEWIEEAPTVGGRVATLANYGESTFDPGTVNGGNPALVANDGGVMIQRNKQVSTPSLPDSDTDGFNMAYGSTTPPAPQS